MAHVTDMFGRAVNVGDHIAFSGPAGTGSSQMYVGLVDKVVATIPLQGGRPEERIREDQQRKARPTVFWNLPGILTVREVDIETLLPHEGWHRKTLTAGQMRNFIRVEIAGD